MYTNSGTRKELESRLLCPVCNMGFIKIDDDMENKLIFPSQHRRILIPTSHPCCSNCRTRYEIVIDKTLKITYKILNY